MNWFDIFGVYALLSLIIVFVTAPILDIYGYKPLSWKTIFIFQWKLYEDMKDELNIFGIVILELITTVLTLGVSLILFITTVITLIFTLLWKTFYLIFRKRDK